MLTFTDSSPTYWHTIFANLHLRIDRITLSEILLITALILTSILVSRHTTHALKQRTGKRFLYSLSRLFAPFLASITMGFASVLLDKTGHPPLLTPLAFKICVAWLAIRVVRQLCRGERLAGRLILFLILPATILHLLGIWMPLMDLLHSIKFTIGSHKTNLYHIIKTLAALALLLSIAHLLMRGVEMRIARLRGIRASNRTLIIKFAQIGLYVIAFLIALQILGISLAAFSVIGGALGVGIGFGLQKIASNFMSGIILLFEKSIEVDDLVELADGTQGFIRQISARYTRIETQEEKEIIVPNEDFIIQRVTTLTHTNTRGRIDILVDVTYGSDYEKALELMLQAAHITPKCLADPKPQSFITQLAESGVTLCLYFWIPNVKDGRAEPRSQVLLAILKSFAAHGIGIAYPTREVRVISDTTPKHPEEASV